MLVVRQSDGLPGQGWWVGGAKKHGYTGLWEGPEGGEADPQAAERRRSNIGRDASA